MSDFQINLQQKPDVLGGGPIPPRVGPWDERREIFSVFQEAKINVLVWLVLVQAGAKEEEH